LQKLILDQLALEILAGKYTEGDHIKIDLSSAGTIIFKKKGV
jgi:ATP-dependent Clp protease ATP-binding subunit ClpA